MPKEAAYEKYTDTTNTQIQQKNESNLPSVMKKKYHQSFLFQRIKKYSTLPPKIKKINMYNSFIHAPKERYFKQM